MFKNNLRQNKLIIYRLKRNFGQTIVLKKPIENGYNLQTGVVTRDYTLITISRAAVLPSEVVRSFSYDLSYIATNKNFTYGGLFDKDTRNILIDKKDISSHSIDNSWFCTISDVEYIITASIYVEQLAGYLVTCSRTDNSG